MLRVDVGLGTYSRNLASVYFDMPLLVNCSVDPSCPIDEYMYISANLDTNVLQGREQTRKMYYIVVGASITRQLVFGE